MGGRGHCGTNWPTEVVGIATLLEFDKMIDSSLSLVAHVFSYTAHLKKTQRMAFEKKCWKEE